MEVNAVPLINGRAYDYAQISVTLLNSPLLGIEAITYTEDQEKVNNYGAGSKPVSRGHAAVELAASLDIHMDDIERLRDAAPDRKLLKIAPFDIVVTFMNEGKVKVHTLKSVEFTSDGVEASQGDTKVMRSFPLVLGDITYE